VLSALLPTGARGTGQNETTSRRLNKMEEQKIIELAKDRELIKVENDKDRRLKIMLILLDKGEPWSASEMVNFINNADDSYYSDLTADATDSFSDDRLFSPEELIKLANGCKLSYPLEEQEKKFKEYKKEWEKLRGEVQEKIAKYRDEDKIFMNDAHETKSKILAYLSEVLDTIR
jgi:hypothetical protein